MKNRFTEAQIIGVLKEAGTGVKVAEICRMHGISDATYYNWKAKFGGMTVSEAQRQHAFALHIDLQTASGYLSQASSLRLRKRF